MGNPLTRDDYAKMSEINLRSRLAAVRDRIHRAETVEESLADSFCEQEIVAAMIARNLLTYTGN